MARLPHSILAAMLALLPATAIAEDHFEFVGLEYEVSAVSDYRYRGLSLTDSKPALQGGVTASLTNGAYGYAWASQIDEYGSDLSGKGAQVETDMGAGWAGVVGRFEVDASVQAYLYPGGKSVNYLELPLTVSRDWGDWGWKLGLAYAPQQKALGHKDNLYRSAEVHWASPSVPVEFTASAGYETGAYAPEGKWDWSVGIRHDFGVIALGATYVDSDAATAGAALVGALSAKF